MLGGGATGIRAGPAPVVGATFRARRATLAAIIILSSRPARTIAPLVAPSTGRRQSHTGSIASACAIARARTRTSTGTRTRAAIAATAGAIGSIGSTGSTGSTGPASGSAFHPPLHARPALPPLAAAFAHSVAIGATFVLHPLAGSRPAPLLAASFAATLPAITAAHQHADGAIEFLAGDRSVVVGIHRCKQRVPGAAGTAALAATRPTPFAAVTAFAAAIAPFPIAHRHRWPTVIAAHAAHASGSARSARSTRSTRSTHTGPALTLAAIIVATTIVALGIAALAARAVVTPPAAIAIGAILHAAPLSRRWATGAAIIARLGRSG